MGKIVVLHERWKCIGCGACVAVCPEYWEMNEDGKSDLKGAVENAEKEEQTLELDEAGCNEDAQDSCPVECIHVKRQE